MMSKDDKLSKLLTQSLVIDEKEFGITVNQLPRIHTSWPRPLGPLAPLASIKVLIMSVFFTQKKKELVNKTSK